MSDHIPDAGKKVCPHCGAGVEIMADGRLCSSEDGSWDSFECLTTIHKGYDSRMFQSRKCERAERDQLRARVEDLEAQIEATAWHYTPAPVLAKIQQLNKRVEELEAYVGRLEELGDSMAQDHYLSNPIIYNDWIMTKQTKPEGLR